MKAYTVNLILILVGILTLSCILLGCQGPEKAPTLTNLQVDGGYSITFTPETMSYEVRIPDGRPRIPKISAAAGEGLTVALTQAVIADGQTSGTAYAKVTTQRGTSTEYKVTFIRDAGLGYHLQYGDCKNFPEEVTAKAASYTSTDPNAITVTPKGLIYAKNLSDTPVTVAALAADGTQLASLTVDKVVKAPLNIFLITGQSNAYGAYDQPSGVDYATFEQSQKALSLTPAIGTVFCTDVDNVGTIQNEMYDLSVGRPGFSPALGKTWYDLTGEKTLMIQTAVGGAPIEAWMKPDGTTRNTYIETEANFYETTYNTFQYTLQKLNAEDSGYELNRVHAYWLQGETGMDNTYDPNRLGPGRGDWRFGIKDHTLNAQEYYDIFMKNMEYFRQDFGCEFMGILLVRATTGVSSEESLALQLLTDLVPARAAQYALHNSNDISISLVSRVCDISRMESYPDATVEGWGYMGCNNLHYNQAGYNANGVEAATNTYKALYDHEGRKASSIEIVLANGRDRLAEGQTITLMPGQSYQTAAMVLPMYTDTPVITCKVANEKVCTVDKFGVITAKADAAGKETTITYSCASGLERTVTIKVGTMESMGTVYEWNFDGGDLAEAKAQNSLTVSAMTGSNAVYSIVDGVYTSGNNLTNFSLEKPIRIGAEHDWSIEWRGVVSANSVVLGHDEEKANTMQIAYTVPYEVKYPLRFVGADGVAVMVSYGEYKDQNTAGMNTWKAAYTAADKTLTLYLNGKTVVGTATVPEGWYAEFTNLLGTYSEGSRFDYQGSLDWIKITTVRQEINIQ